MSEALIARERDGDLTPANVKKDVVIYDTEGIYSGVLGGRDIQYLCNPSNYTIESGFITTLAIYVESTNYIVCILGVETGGSYWYIGARISKTGTLAIIPPPGTGYNSTSGAANMASAYKDGNILHVNFSNNTHDDYDMETGVRSGSIGGVNTNGDLQNGTPIIVDGLTYTFGMVLIDASTNHLTLTCSITS